MAAKPDLRTTPEQEKLWYFVMLREMEAQSEGLRAAYKRLAAAALDATGWDTRTLILGWLEAELRTLRRKGDDRGATAAHLMAAAVSLANALKQ